jgi:pimeloyl-ACP methyl ester carboxylesterase
MAKAGTLVPGTPEYAARVGPPSPEFSARLNAAVMQNRASPGYWRATLSIIREQLGGDGRAIAAASRPPGNMPIVVLTAAQTLGAVQAQGGEAARALVLSSHQEMAAASAGGVSRVVDCGHGIQWERPDAVVAAIEEVLAACRTG